VLFGQRNENSTILQLNTMTLQKQAATAVKTEEATIDHGRLLLYAPSKDHL
jgi:hypothetical protein